MRGVITLLALSAATFSLNVIHAQKVALYAKRIRQVQLLVMRAISIMDFSWLMGSAVMYMKGNFLPQMVVFLANIFILIAQAAIIANKHSTLIASSVGRTIYFVITNAFPNAILALKNVWFVRMGSVSNAGPLTCFQ